MVTQSVYSERMMWELLEIRKPYSGILLAIISAKLRTNFPAVCVLLSECLQRWYPKIRSLMMRLDVREQTNWADRADFPVPGFPIIRTPVISFS